MTVMDEQQMWAAVLARDARYDDQFVYAVRTTGVFCRPTCPSRRPLRQNVAFFVTTDEAIAAGFRPCLRCHPATAERVEPQVDLIVAVCRYLEQPHEQTPTLSDLGQRFAMSPYHLQRTFKRIVGVSPRQYADDYRRGRLKRHLRHGERVVDAVYAAGYGASSGIYAVVDDTLGMTPVHYREGGRTMQIRYTIVPCGLGWLLVAATERGICKISLGDSETDLTADLTGEFPAAARSRDDDRLGAWVRVLLAYIDDDRRVLDLPLDIQATGFQRRVWEALRSIPYGSTRSYQQVAAQIGQPEASRAVAQACASNPVALVIPCHRVVRKGGALSGYCWGVARKESLLAHERAVMGRDSAD
ncbi:MAG: bifunctional DNA-binding transcriptional regulator/O6-methylguanine-DNA methyltransferase Ada [Chloroflexota bacterium]